MRRDRSDEQGSAADPVQDEVGVHTNISRDLAIPIADALEIVEAEFQCILVVCAIKLDLIQPEIREKNEIIGRTPRNGSG